MKKPHKFAPAFTVVEILIASAIMAVLVAVILGITSSVLTAWNNASNSLSRNFESRVSLDLIVQDLEAALFRSDGSIWMVSETEAVTDKNTDSPLGNIQANLLKFFTVAPDRPEGPGDVSAVCYFLESQNPFGGTAGATFNLYRVVVNGESTFKDFLGKLKDKEKVDFLGANATPDPYSAAFLANNVIEFRVEFTLQIIDTTGATRIVRQAVVRNVATDFFGESLRESTNPSKPIATIPGDIEFFGDYQIPNAPNNPTRIQKPLYADVYIRIIDEEGLRILEADARESGVIPDDQRDDFLRSHSELFSRRVHFINNPI